MPLDHYRSIAPLYDRVVSPLLQPVRRDIAAYIRFKGYRRVIDVCCGTGDQLRLLDAPGMELCGIDNSLAMLEQAQKSSSETISYHLLDSEQATFAPGTFDCAIVSFSLHEKHPTAALAVYANSRRMVRPGGSLILADFSRPSATPGGILYGRIAIPLVERLAGRDHYAGYRLWMKHGALEGFLDSRQVASDIICQPFGRSVLCCAVAVTAGGLSLSNSLALLSHALNPANPPANG
ncbi:class I SAM-dependent methyltransferase [Desulfofustis glycolicus]|uniref:Ubiquinone/menaquinone biosynthesis C-methylase UbiE n=1 Tax=Desulfofustis glycolicus DSM 9705 TaxID=1121409 RepID=A0A1M5Y8W7_9BACT|nr:class I SAM-dependent methyltransferase [Desulfofustis glycolicus]SHI08396.1 Ubiquinone/menaquinone biosynthesis C-methylase UbiE [Desulfofustis glycolicus DSM 9705]